MYGYKLAGTPFQHPGPVLCVHEGHTVTITLTNTLPRDMSMIFPGQHNVLADGRRPRRSSAHLAIRRR